MKSVEAWRESKFRTDNSGLYPALDSNELCSGSWLIASRVCRFYSRAIRKHATGRLLDLGCGKAPMFGYYRNFVKEVVLVDWPNSLHDNPHIDVFQDITEPLQLPPGHFDTVILSDVLEHIPHPRRLLVEVERVLRPGGVLLMNVPFMYGVHEQPYDYYRYTSFAIRDIAETAGLSTISIEPIGGLPEVFGDLIAKTLSRAPLVGRRLALLVQRFVDYVTIKTPLKRFAESSADVWPLGYVCIFAKLDD